MSKYLHNYQLFVCFFKLILFYLHTSNIDYLNETFILRDKNVLAGDYP